MTLLNTLLQVHHQFSVQQSIKTEPCIGKRHKGGGDEVGAMYWGTLV